MSARHPVRMAEREAGGQEMFRNQGFWGQTRNVGSEEETCLPGSSCVCERSTCSLNGEVGLPQSHETFPC